MPGSRSAWRSAVLPGSSWGRSPGVSARPCWLGLAGFVIGGLYALLPSVVGSLLVVSVARRSSHVRRDLAITIAAIVGVLGAVSLMLDPHTWPGVLLWNVVMAPMLWWAWRYLARTAEAAV